MAYYQISPFSLVKLVEQKMGNFPKKQTRRFTLKKWGYSRSKFDQFAIEKVTILNLSILGMAFKANYY